jgi:hypothetical protein
MIDHDDAGMRTPLTPPACDSCGPAATLDHDTLVDVAMQSSARYASYGNRVQFDRANECMAELKRRLAEDTWLPLTAKQRNGGGYVVHNADWAHPGECKFSKRTGLWMDHGGIAYPQPTHYLNSAILPPKNVS